MGKFGVKVNLQPITPEKRAALTKCRQVMVEDRYVKMMAVAGGRGRVAKSFLDQETQAMFSRYQEILKEKKQLRELLGLETVAVENPPGRPR